MIALKIPSMAYRTEPLVAGVAILAAGAAGVATSRFGMVFPAAIAACLGAWLAVSRYGLAVPIVFFFAVAVGAFPAVNPRSFAVSSIEVGDLAFAGLIATLVLAAVLMPERPRVTPRGVRWMLRLSVALSIYWLIEVMRTIAEGTPPAQVLRIGRDFAFFAVLLPLTALVLQDRRLRTRVVIGLAAAASVAAAIRVFATLGSKSLIGTVIFSDRATAAGSLPRLDGTTDDLASAMAAVAVSALILRAVPLKRSHRWIAICAAGLGLLFLILIQTRARYLTIPIGLATLVAVSRAPAHAGLRLAGGLATALIVGTVAIPLLNSEAVDSAVQTVTDRFAQTNNRGTPSSRDTVGYRQRVATSMQDTLDRRGGWVFGLGFLSPSSKPEPSLPGGAIRNPDVGIFNALMTMGIAGTLLFYAVVMSALAFCLRGVRDAVGLDAALSGGALAYGVTALAASLTLVTLFSTQGLITTALVLGIGVAASVGLPPRPKGRSSVPETQVAPL